MLQYEFKLHGVTIKGLSVFTFIVEHDVIVHMEDELSPLQIVLRGVPHMKRFNDFYKANVEHALFEPASRLSALKDLIRELKYDAETQVWSLDVVDCVRDQRKRLEQAFLNSI